MYISFYYQCTIGSKLELLVHVYKLYVTYKVLIVMTVVVIEGVLVPQHMQPMHGHLAFTV